MSCNSDQNEGIKVDVEETENVVIEESVDEDVLTLGCDLKKDEIELKENEFEDEIPVNSSDKKMEKIVKTRIQNDVPQIENNNSRNNIDQMNNKDVQYLHSKFPNGITLSWNVDAYVKTEETLKQRIKNKCSKATKGEGLNSNLKQILHKVNGIVKPGQLCAIMGASGAGKTTLMNILSFRNRLNLVIEDDIRVNGKSVNAREISIYSGYVQQNDLFIGTLTVKEQLILYAMLRMDREITTEQKYARVDEVVHQLNLYKCQDTRIGMGDLAKGISGGEKRRLAFAAEILNNPPLLFADEPTSGLDTFMALTVVDILVNLAKQGKTLICTIHQPSSQIFEKFDTLCLLSQGRVAFYGAREDALVFFSRLGFQCPLSGYNPADYYIQVLAVASQIPNSDRNSEEKSKRICDAYEKSEHIERVNSMISQLIKENSGSDDTKLNNYYNSSYLTQMRWLLWREKLNLLRNPIATYILIFQTSLIGLFFGFLTLQSGFNEIYVQNYIGILYALVMQAHFLFVPSVLNSIQKELPILYREVKNRTYSVYTYFLAKNLVDFPKFIITPFVFVTIIYWMSGIQNNVTVFFRVAALLVFMTQIAVGYGLFLSIAAPNQRVVVAIAMPIAIPLSIVGGYFLNNDSVPNYLAWLKYISWFYHTNSAVSIQFWSSIKSIPCTNAVNSTLFCPLTRCFENGDEVLSSYLNIDKSSFNLNVGIMFVLFVVFRFATLLVLKLKTR